MCADVSTDQVGKYRYGLSTANGHLWVPLILDVNLVGRTKILKLHSALWIENSSTVRLTLRMQLPSATASTQTALQKHEPRSVAAPDSIQEFCLSPGDGESGGDQLGVACKQNSIRHCYVLRPVSPHLTSEDWYRLFYQLDTDIKGVNCDTQRLIDSIAALCSTLHGTTMMTRGQIPQSEKTVYIHSSAWLREVCFSHSGDTCCLFDVIWSSSSV